MKNAIENAIVFYCKQKAIARDSFKLSKHILCFIPHSREILLKRRYTYTSINFTKFNQLEVIFYSPESPYQLLEFVQNEKKQLLIL